MKKYEREYQFLRPIIIFLYNFKCVVCNGNPDNFEVHHKDGDALNNDPFNLFPLCKACHKGAHSGKFKYSLKVPNWIVLDLSRVKAFVRRSYY